MWNSDLGRVGVILCLTEILSISEERLCVSNATYSSYRLTIYTLTWFQTSISPECHAVLTSSLNSVLIINALLLFWEPYTCIVSRTTYLTIFTFKSHVCFVLTKWIVVTTHTAVNWHVILDGRVELSIIGLMQDMPVIVLARWLGMNINNCHAHLQWEQNTWISSQEHIGLIDTYRYMETDKEVWHPAQNLRFL